MIPKLLAIDNETVFNKQKEEWTKHGILAIRVDAMHDAIELVNTDDFVIIVINSDYIDYKPLLKILRDITPLPIYILTSNYNDHDKRIAYDLGADHYSKWYSDIKEGTICGVRMIQRYIERNTRQKRNAKFFMHYGIYLYPHYRKVYANNVEVPLTRKEYELLFLLMKNKYRVLEYDQIYDHIWGEENLTTQNALRVLITKLKQKFDAAGLPLTFLQNVHDIGYRLDVPEI